MKPKYWLVLLAISICLFFSTMLLWAVRLPPIPVSWTRVKPGMTREEAFLALGWPKREHLSPMIEEDAWGYSPILYRHDAILTIRFKELPAGTAEIVDEVIVSYGIDNWQERVEGRYSVFGLRLWKW